MLARYMSDAMPCQMLFIGGTTGSSNYKGQIDGEELQEETTWDRAGWMDA